MRMKSKGRGGGSGAVRFPRVVAVLLVVVGGAVGVAGIGQAGTRESAAAVRVGTFDSRGVALAYGRSDRPDCLLAEVAGLRRELDRAKREGVQERIEELEAMGPALQRQIHRQVFSGAPIDDILVLIENDLPHVAAAAGVDLIVSGVLHHGPGVELVDVTLEMCAPFAPDDETLRMIERIVATPPVDESELSHEH